MWSKTKQALMVRMADCLKKRIRYNFEVYTTKWRHSEMSVFYIYVDNKLWFASNPMSYSKEMEYLNENVDKSLPYHEYWVTHTKAHSDASIMHQNMVL